MKRFFQKAYHFFERIIRESRAFPSRIRIFGIEVAVITFIDGLIPPGKSRQYINTIEKYVDYYLKDLTETYQNKKDSAEICINPGQNEKIPIWCCWWQGEEQMPEIVKMCHERLKQIIPEDKAQLHLITLDNYAFYVELPEHIITKFNKGIVTMTAMSDVLRFHLLNKYGGYWLDATVFFTDDIPKEYFSERFYCQRMASDSEKGKREACRGNWCGFSMAGSKNSVIFQYMCDAFSKWWKDYDTIIDYVLIDYILLTGYKYIPAITEMINTVPDNNEDIFEMYQVLNQPYSRELYRKVTQKNVMHKLTYKMELQKVTKDGQMTLYGYLLKMVYKNAKG